MDKLFFRTNSETLDFFELNRNKSREEVLIASRTFFGSIKTNRPNTLLAKLKDFAYQHKIVKQKIKTKIMKQRKGAGKGSSIPPDDFRPRDLSYFGLSNDKSDCYTCKVCEISSIREDDILECFENVNEDPDYKAWQKEITKIPLVTFESVEEKEIHDEIFKGDIKQMQVKLKDANSKCLNCQKRTKTFKNLAVHKKKHFV